MNWQAHQTVTEQKPYKYITFTCLTSNVSSSSARPLRSFLQRLPSRVAHSTCSRGGRFLILSAHHWLLVISHPARPKTLLLVPCLTPWTSQGQWFSSRTPLMSRQAPDERSCSWRRPGGDLQSTGEKKEKEKRRGKKSHVKHICNINTCFDFISLITVYSSTFKSFRKRSEE